MAGVIKKQVGASYVSTAIGILRKDVIWRISIYNVCIITMLFTSRWKQW